jgi:hypothetical protein
MVNMIHLTATVIPKRFVACRASTVDRSAAPQTQQGKSNIAPFHHTKVEDANPFVIVAQKVTDLIIHSWIQTGEDLVMDDLGLQLLDAAAEEAEADVSPRSLEHRTQIYEMWADWDRFSA